MKKKILIFSLAYYPKHIGGAEVAIKEITDRIAPEEYEFHLLCNRYDASLPTRERIGNVYVHRIGLTTNNPTMANLRKFPLHLAKLIYQFQAFWVAKRLHQQEKFDGIWAMMAHATGVPAAKFKKAFPDVKYVLTLQEGDPPEHIEKKMRPFVVSFRAAFITADVVQVISNFLGRWAKRKGYRGEPILVPNAVNTAHFAHVFSDDELQSVKDELGKKPDDIYLVTTSRLVYKNAIDDVVRAMTQLPKNVHFVVYGTGPEESALKALSAEMGVAERVHLCGHIDHSVMPKYLKACDIFIRPSRSEGMGNSFIEAMAAGLPVIATQEGGIADFLFDRQRNPLKEQTGWAVDVDSPEQIVLAVSDILSDSERTRKVVANAQKMVMERYDWRMIAQAMKEKVFDPLWSER